MKSLVIKGIITNTSNKVNEKYKTDTPTKTAYIEVDEESAKEMIEFGLTQYTSEADENNFFILRLTKELTVYDPEDADLFDNSIDLSSVDTPNWRIDSPVAINILAIHSDEWNTTFHRLKAIQVKMDDIERIEQANPFENIEDDVPF